MEEHDEETPDFLREEKKRDPMEIAQKYLDMVEKAMGPGGALAPSRVQRVYAPPPPPPHLSVTVQQIQNGYLVNYGPPEAPEALYAPDAEGVLGAVRALFVGFLRQGEGGRTPAAPPCPEA